MAYVATSKQNINDIERKIFVMAAAAIKKVGDNPLPASPVINKQKLSALLWKGREELAAQMPSEWKCGEFGANVKITYKGEQVATDHDRDLTFAATGYSVCLNVNTDPPMFPPKTPNSYYSHTVRFDISMFDISDEMMAAHAEWITKITAEVEKWKTVKRQVVSMLERCKSVNQAVKLMPTFRMYIPDEMLEKIDEKVERRATSGKGGDDPLEGVDVGLLNRIAVTSRILGSSE